MTIEVFLKKNGYSDIEINNELVGRDIDKPDILIKEVLRGHLYHGL